MVVVRPGTYEVVVFFTTQEYPQPCLLDSFSFAIPVVSWSFTIATDSCFV